MVRDLQPTTKDFLDDPRHYQILVLGSLLLYGIAVLDLPIAVLDTVLILAAAIATQLVFSLGLRLRGADIPFDLRSPLISGLSLCLLARANTPLPLMLAAAIAIASKFLLRRGGKHVFNPTNFGLVAMMALGDAVWVSPGQWGSTAYFGFLLACLGGLVVNRAARSDVTYAFLAAYAGLLFGRALWLGDPPSIPLHGMQSGALILFAFFMISDPKTTPDSRAGRVLFAVVVALGAGFVQFGLYRPNGLLWALVASAPLVPLIDRLLPGEHYRWPTVASPERAAKQTRGEINHASTKTHPAIGDASPVARPAL